MDEHQSPPPWNPDPELMGYMEDGQRMPMPNSEGLIQWIKPTWKEGGLTEEERMQRAWHIHRLTDRGFWEAYQNAFMAGWRAAKTDTDETSS